MPEGETNKKHWKGILNEVGFFKGWNTLFASQNDGNYSP